MKRYASGSRRVFSFILAALMLITFIVPASAMGFDDLSTVIDAGSRQVYGEIPVTAEITDVFGSEPDAPDTYEPSVPDAGETATGGVMEEPDELTEEEKEPEEIPLGASGDPEYGEMPDGFTFTVYPESPFGIMTFSNTGTTITMTRNDFIKHRYPFKNGTSMFSAYIFSTSDGRAAYCVEPAKFNSTNNTWMTGSVEFDALSSQKQLAIAKAIAANTSGTSNPANYVATQAIIWEIVYGEKHRTGSVYSAVIAANAAQLGSVYEGRRGSI